MPAFDVDVKAVATAVVRHLVASGRRRIAMLSGPEWMQCQDGSEHAYATVLRDAGLPRRLLTGDFTASSGRAGAREVLRRWPDTDAVFAVCDAAALGAVGSLRDAGRQVPGDVAVAGFDDIPAAELSWPTLMTATHPVEQIAAAAVEAALDGARGDDVLLFGSELVARAST